VQGGTFAPDEGLSLRGTLMVPVRRNASSLSAGDWLTERECQPMSFFSAMAISGSGLTAEQTRMDTISDNIANVNTTQTPQGGPYQREDTIFTPIAASDPFAPPPPPTPLPGGGVSQALPVGVMVSSIATDKTPGRLVYDPTNPLANAGGYVAYPNVNLVTEISDMMGATRAYQANVTALNATKSMASDALTIGQGH
jgi:flagellar basal-body rod protein FlgC